MSLVAYGSSDDSEGEAEAQARPPSSLADPTPAAELGSRPRKRGEPVRISAPELRAKSDSDDEEPLQKKASQSLGPGTGLSCLLPQPRHLPRMEADCEPSPAPRPFAKRPGRIPAPTRVTAAPSPSAIKAASKSAAKELARHIMSEKASDGEEEGEDEEEEEEEEEEVVGGGPAGFFSLSDTPTLPEGNLPDPNPADAPLEFNRGTSSIGDMAPTDPVPSYLDYAAQDAEHSDYYQNYSNYYEGLDPTLAPAPEEELNTFMNDEAFKRLQGKRNRSKEEVSFVEIKGDDQLSGSQQWLMKSLTEEKDMKSFSKKRGEQPTSQQRRKHQITYLIHQAKERELELKNSWSDNRLTKRQTQAKYGF